MAATDLAIPSVYNHNAAGHPPVLRDPFSSPVQPPKPCAHPHNARSAHYEAAARPTADDSMYHSNDRSSSTYKPSSLSSGGSSSLMTPMSSIDLEKSKPSRQPKRAERDPEKVMSKSRRDSPQQLQQPQQQQQFDHGDAASLAYSDEDVDDAGRRVQEEKAVKILLFLSGPCVVLSALNTIWAVISTIITCLTQPVRLCARRPNFGQQLSGLLGPALNLQLKAIYTPLPPHANDDRSYHAMTLVMVHILSPFISLGMMFMAWVLAVYWLSSAVVGDPAGMDKRDDGRETVLGLRNWWERYLMRSVMDD
jgi:hypothetical protein